MAPLFTGQLSANHGLLPAFKSLCSMAPISPGVMLIKAPQGEAELAISDQGLIVGAMIRGKGEQGLFALKKILDWKSGIYAFFAETEYPSDHLKKALRMDIFNIVKGIEGEDSAPSAASATAAAAPVQPVPAQPVPAQPVPAQPVPAEPIQPQPAQTQPTQPASTAATATTALVNAQAASAAEPVSSMTAMPAAAASNESNDFAPVNSPTPISPPEKLIGESNSTAGSVAQTKPSMPLPPDYTPLPGSAPDAIPTQTGASEGSGSKFKKRKFAATNFAMDVFEESPKPATPTAVDGSLAETNQDFMQTFSDLNRLGSQASSSAQARRTINAPPVELPVIPIASEPVKPAAGASATPAAISPTAHLRKSAPPPVTSTLLEGPVLTPELLGDGPLTMDVAEPSLGTSEQASYAPSPEAAPEQIVQPAVQQTPQQTSPSLASIGDDDSPDKHTRTLLEGPILTPELLAEGTLTQPESEVFGTANSVLDSPGYANATADTGYSNGSFASASGAGPGYVSGGFPATSTSVAATGFAASGYGAAASVVEPANPNGSFSATPGGASTTGVNGDHSTAGSVSSPANALAKMASFAADDDDDMMSISQPAAANTVPDSSSAASAPAISGLDPKAALKNTAGASILEAMRKSKTQTGKSSTVPEQVPSVLRVPSMLGKQSTGANPIADATADSATAHDAAPSTIDNGSPTLAANAQIPAQSLFAASGAAPVPIPPPGSAPPIGTIPPIITPQPIDQNEKAEEQDPAALAALARLERFRTDKPTGSTFGNLDEMVASQRLRQSEALGLPTEVQSSPDLISRAKAEAETAAPAAPAVSITKARMRSMEPPPPAAAVEITIPPVVKKFKPVLLIVGIVAAVVVLLLVGLFIFKAALSGETKHDTMAPSSALGTDVKPLVPQGR